MTMYGGPDREAEHHWRDTLAEIDEAIDHAYRTEEIGRTIRIRLAATAYIQRLNWLRNSVFTHHPGLPTQCACHRDGCRLGPVFFQHAA
jgi:hypothetical protein